MRQMQGRLKTPVRAAVSWEAPVLTDEQQVVVEHDAGPLLVLGGPGTGKTTALVEAAVRWGHERREPPLVLTFSRQAALDLRARIVGRSGRTEHAPQVFTVHGLCFALLRQHASTGEEPLRLLTAPQQEFRVRETLAVDEPTMGVEWPESMAEAVRTQGFAAELRAVIARARQLGMDGRDLQQVGVAAERPEWVSAGGFMEEYLELLDFEHAIDYAELVHRTRILLADDEIAATVRSGFSAVLVDEFQDTTPRRWRCCVNCPVPTRIAPSSRSGIRTSRCSVSGVPTRVGSWSSAGSSPTPRASRHRSTCCSGPIAWART